MKFRNRLAALLGALFVFASTDANATTCGDVDANGDVLTSDALAVLRRSVHLPGGALECEACVVPTTTSSTCCYDECFNDEDCVEAGYPADWSCGGEWNAFCVECGTCPGDDECVNWRCINGCGDFDADGAVAASDALMVLKSAVGQAVALQCPGCADAFVTTSSSFASLDR